jgi:hypothetical protein
MNMLLKKEKKKKKNSQMKTEEPNHFYPFIIWSFVGQTLWKQQNVKQIVRNDRLIGIVRINLIKFPRKSSNVKSQSNHLS